MKWQPTHMHYKGGLYRVLHRGFREYDMEPVTIYDNAEGTVFVRLTDEFDGHVTGRQEPNAEPAIFARFAPLPDPPTP